MVSTFRRIRMLIKFIRKDHYIGKFHELEFEAKKYPNGFEIGFFQNVVYENPNGGRHDFDKLSKMPHMTRLRYTKFKNKILCLLGSLVPDIYDDSTLSPKLAEEWIKCRYVESCHHEQKKHGFLTFEVWTDRHRSHTTGLTGIKKQSGTGKLNISAGVTAIYTADASIMI